MTSPTPRLVAGRRLRVAVIFGGRSSEHGVSCLTAGEVIRAIDSERYEVVPVGITHEGRWVLESDDPQRFAITERRLPSVDPLGAHVVLAGDSTRRELSVHEPGQLPRALGEVDVVMPLLHGPWGEDGTIQGLLEMAAVRYVGAGVLASAVAMDKHHMKVAFAAAGLPLLPYVVVHAPAVGSGPRHRAHRGRRLGIPRLRQALPGRFERRDQPGRRGRRARRGLGAGTRE
jgi:D-alanine-D-alanine ligase